MLAPETPLHLLEHSVLAMLFIFASIREFEVDPDASLTKTKKTYHHFSKYIKCIIERYCRNLGILLPTLVRPHPVIQQFCVPERKSSLFEARVARAMLEPRGMGELSSRTAMSLGNPALEPLYWGCCGRIRDV